ncbi:DUF2157 domain-containing protein [Undibacterium cyanobacteriorum]|uniref:DUF2157 domain-containing protein n=1 Tax=Undibacterium cyanobacteriorum TaxID=3073561 RepID=A0ABY9RK42_9BURK|nr:DUF2157 domain-containing protein [Undibacterium sp. 20NA77.5]WMW81316.1 DUF2157 domain-containing protein [Undibacterium sp. 20NA77.5]
MKITRQQLDQAIDRNILSNDQGNALWQFLAEHSNDTASFKASHILYYLGGMLAIGAMSLFMTLGWAQFGGFGLMMIALVYAGICVSLLETVLNHPQFAIPSGIVAALIVVLAPLAIYGLQSALGYMDDHENYRDYHVFIDWRWIIMELGSLVVGIVVLWRYRLPFSVMPIAVTLWYMSMDLTPFLFGDADNSWELRKWVSVVFGLLMLMVALIVDLRDKQSKDYAFWIYLFGVLAFWGGLSSMNSGSELGKLIYCLINLGMIALGAVLARRVFAVFGGLGVAGYVGHLAYQVFKDSLMFPFALTVIGFAVIGLGLVWQRREAEIASCLRTYLPTRWREMVESRS